MNFKIISKNAIHILLDEEGLLNFITILENIRSTHSGNIGFEEVLNYRGEKLSGIIFYRSEDGEFVSFQNNHLSFEIEHEMYDDLLIVLKRAVVEKSFRTLELMEFQPKSKKDCSVTLYGIYNESDI